MLAFSAVHLLLFLRVNPLVSAAALVVAALGAYPLAHLCERVEGNAWPGVLLHSLAHLVTVIGAPAQAVAAALTFMAVAALCPWLVFLVARSGQLPTGAASAGEAASDRPPRAK